MSERKGVLLRLDPAVHDALARWANDELRSTNAQIEFLLRRALADAAGYLGTPDRCAPAAGHLPTSRLKHPPTTRLRPARQHSGNRAYHRQLCGLRRGRPPSATGAVRGHGGRKC